jgi:hypothetical protein
VNRIGASRTWVTSLARLGSLALAALLATALVPGCSQGGGSGSATGTLDVPDCWSGPFDLKPDFFAAIPSDSTDSDSLQIRVQNGGDYENFSDGIAILVDDAGEVRGDPTPDGVPRPSLLHQALVVALSPSVTPPGVPIVAEAHPSIVHASLYLDKTCRTQNIALYALDAVSLNPDGSCARPDGGEAAPCGTPETPATLANTTTTGSTSDASTTSATLDASTTADASTGADATVAASPNEAGGTPIGTSTIVFNSLFDGNAAETNAQQRLTDATFDFYFADPREICPGGLGPPPPCRGHLTGYFKFYFERGVPAQPFP